MQSYVSWLCWIGKTKHWIYCPSLVVFLRKSSWGSLPVFVIYISFSVVILHLMWMTALQTNMKIKCIIHYYNCSQGFRQADLLYRQIQPTVVLLSNKYYLLSLSPFKAGLANRNVALLLCIKGTKIEFVESLQRGSIRSDARSSWHLLCVCWWMTFYRREKNVAMHSVQYVTVRFSFIRAACSIQRTTMLEDKALEHAWMKAAELYGQFVNSVCYDP